MAFKDWVSQHPETLVLLPDDGERLDGRRGYLGVQLRWDEPVIEQVMPETAAARAGLQKGDRFVSIGGEVIEVRRDITRLLRRRQPGDRIEIVVVRGEEKVAVEVELGTPP